MITIYLERGFQGLIGSFGLAIHLWVIGHTKVLFYLQLLADFLKQSGGKARVPVRDDAPGKSDKGECSF
jgi:hypothetical protein